MVWVLRTDRLDRRGMLRRDADPVTPSLSLPGFGAGSYGVTFWDTLEGNATGRRELAMEEDGRLRVELPPRRTDLALAIRRL